MLELFLEVFFVPIYKFTLPPYCLIIIGMLVSACIRPLLRTTILLMGVILLLWIPLSVFAQQYGSLEIAKTYIISEDEVNSGDIVVFDRKTQQFHFSRQANDKNVFGVIALEPLLVIEVDPDGIPVVRGGETLVNVTTLNGPITAGDYITSSSIPGKGQRALEGDTYIVGIALDSFSGDVSVKAGETVVGSIRVLLSIGTQEQAAAVISGESAVKNDANTGVTEATVLNIVQYFLAAFIAVGSLYVAFKNFGPSIKSGIVSIGRNPLAKSSIQSMVILNAVLIILISAGGLAVSIAILLLPI